MVDPTKITRYLALLNLLAAAEQNATREEKVKLRLVRRDMRDFDTQESVKMILQIKGEEWRPTGRYAEAIEALV